MSTIKLEEEKKVNNTQTLSMRSADGNLNQFSHTQTQDKEPKRLQKVKLYLQGEHVFTDISKLDSQRSFLNRGVPFRANMMMWLDQLGLTTRMTERLNMIKEMTFEINGVAAHDFTDSHFKDPYATVVVKKNMTVSQAIDTQLKREIGIVEAAQGLK